MPHLSSLLRLRDRVFATAFLLLAALITPSCIDFEQDIWLAEDGGGRILIKVGISKKALSMAGGLGALSGGGGEDSFNIDVEELRKTLEDDPNVKSFDVREEETETHQLVIADVEVEDLTKLDNVQSPGLMAEPGATGEGDFSITRTDAGTYKLAMKLAAPGEDAGADSGEDDSAGIAAAAIEAAAAQLIGDAAITLRVHADAVSHNGVEEDGAIVWRSPLTALMKGNAFDAQGEFEPPVAGAGRSEMTFWIVLASVIAVAAILFFVFRAQRPMLA